MRLIYRRGREEVAFPIEEGETYIGRKDYCELYFPDGSLSKRHARLVRRGDKLKVFDAGSRNGTLVNGEVVEEARLREGDVIQCGKLQFRVAGVGGRSGDDFDYVDERASQSQKRQAKQSRGSLLVTAKAVASVDARPSMLDVLPELPPSVEAAGYEGDYSAGRSLPADPFPKDEQAPRATFRLVEGGPQQTWEVGEEAITIGSKDENAIVLTGEGVSRYHAEVVFDQGVWVMKDLGARNGLFVAGEKVDIYELKSGDEVQIGSCRLRFELKKPDPLAEFKGVLTALRDDPKGALQRDSRARALVGTVACLLLVGGVTVAGNLRTRTTIVQPTTTDGKPYLQAGSELILKGKFAEARTIFREAKTALPTLEQRVPNHFVQVCTLWATLERDPAGFAWDKAEGLIAGTAKLPDLPRELRGWCENQTAFVTRSREALRIAQEAEGMLERADRLMGEGEIQSALEQLDAAAVLAGKVPAETPFTTRAQAVVLRAQRTAYRSLIREATKVTGQTPDWERGLALLRSANRYVENHDDENKILELRGRFQRNSSDEQSYMRGVDIIQAGQPERYPAAREFFKKVHPRSRVYRHALAYLQWIDADEDVRRAQAAYDNGDARRAFQLLADAFNHESLDKPAKESVRQLHTQWSRVVKAYDRGMELKAANKLKEARLEFEQVLKSEPNARNQLNIRANKEIQSIIDMLAEGYEAKVKFMHESFKDKNWGLFHERAQQVVRDRNRRQKDIDAIPNMVQDANKRLKLYKRCYRAFQRDQEEEFVESARILTVLANWLPTNDPDRSEAKELLEKIKARIRRWKQFADGND